MGAPFIEEFLYRGRGDGSAAWHVVLGAEVDNGFGAVELRRQGPMTPSQAEAAGFPLTSIVANINSEAVATADRLQAEKAALQAQLDAATAENADLIAQLAAMTPAMIDGVPQEVAMNKARKALILAGLMEQVEAAVAAAPGQEGELIRTDWQYATGMKRNAPFVLAMAAAIGLTSEQVDALFVQAAALP